MISTRFLRNLTILLAAVLLVTAIAAGMPGGSRTVLGQVLDENGKAVEGAIVRFRNKQTKKEISVVTNDKGRYQLGGLDLKTDYRIYALKDGRKSRELGVSSFDTRTRVVLDLHFQPPKKKNKEKKKDD